MKKIQVGDLALVVDGCKYTGDKYVGLAVQVVDEVEGMFFVKHSLVSFWCKPHRLLFIGKMK